MLAIAHCIPISGGFFSRSPPALRSNRRQQQSLTLKHRARTGVRATAVSNHTDTFLKVKNEDDILAGIIKEGEAKKLPPPVVEGMNLFYRSYKEAVVKGNVPDAEAVAVRVMSMVFDRIMVQFEDPFTFPSHHLRMTEPYDYYMFGQNYVRPLLDFSNSYLGNPQIWDEMERYLEQGHNVVLLSNHQTEADPAVIALMLETSHPRLAQSLTYVAGDRVVQDPVCKPFSMGRNLLCVYSKKHINDFPEKTAEKMAANRRTLVTMNRLFKTGGLFLWIAPSGGRDRPDPQTGEWHPAPFDPSSVETMRRLVEDAGPPGHIYPTALLCYPIMPPPSQVKKSLGEDRVIGYSGVGLAAMPQVDFETIVPQGEDRKEVLEATSAAIWSRVDQFHGLLSAAVAAKDAEQAARLGREAGAVLAQPWRAPPPSLQEVVVTPANATARG